MWSLRYSSRYFTGWLRKRSWKRNKFVNGCEEVGPVIKKLRETLTGIQMGRIEAPEGWIKEIK